MRPAARGAERVLVLTRPGCHLCEQAVAIVAQVCTETGTGYATRDITGDADLLRRYTDEVPVTFVDGVQHDFWRVDPARLRAALTRR
ncbi:glutaredoxin family protein [uncultured Friedmanniella sp.]|uniref:glutaredoxin family protein n=1 Tax=uncultured Friedmanniella sp. TaxID=335381 RepID=UPI0035CB6446